jgi:hypothetical protein
MTEREAFESFIAPYEGLSAGKKVDMVAAFAAGYRAGRAHSGGDELPDVDRYGWCTHCGCGNNAKGFAHLPSCSRASSVTPAHGAERTGNELGPYSALIAAADEMYRISV